MNDNAPIGLFDSGIGGLTVVKEMQKLLPNENIIYVGDTKRAPYGPRSPVQIVEFMHEILRFFLKEKVKMAVFACNTMTAYGYEEAKKQYPFLVTAMNTGVKQAIDNSTNKKIGIIATQGAIASGMHENAALSMDSTAKVYTKACPEFVPLIEQGKISGNEIKSAAYNYLQPLKESNIQSLILGCTHYPIISNVIREIVGSDVYLVNPAEATALDAKLMLEEHQLIRKNYGQSTTKIYFSAQLEQSKNMSEMILNNKKALYELIEL